MKRDRQRLPIQVTAWWSSTKKTSLSIWQVAMMACTQGANTSTKAPWTSYTCPSPAPNEQPLQQSLGGELDLVDTAIKMMPSPPSLKGPLVYLCWFLDICMVEAWRLYRTLTRWRRKQREVGEPKEEEECWGEKVGGDLQNMTFPCFSSKLIVLSGMGVWTEATLCCYLSSSKIFVNISAIPTNYRSIISYRIYTMTNLGYNPQSKFIMRSSVKKSSK